MASKFIEFTTNETDINVALGFETRTTRLTAVLSEKMTVLMTALQEKAQARVTSTRVRESIKDPRAEVVGSVVTGKLNWGGVPVQYMEGREYDLAKILEYGAKAHPVNPLTNPVTGKPTPREHKAGGLKARAGTKAKVLHFFGGTGSGEKGEGPAGTFRPYTFRQAMLGQFFMAKSIAEMEESFLTGMRDALVSFKETPVSRHFNY